MTKKKLVKAIIGGAALLVLSWLVFEIIPLSNDSSPIIISDGSIVIRHAKPNRDHFTDKNPKKDEEIKAKHHRPKAFGYQCDPSATPVNTACKATPCDFSAKAPCQIDTKPATSWDLSLCESPGPCAAPGTVHIKWSSAGSESMVIHSNKNDFHHTGATSFAGARVKHMSIDHLQSATLVVDSGTPYVFTCPSSSDCLTIGYDK